MQPWLMWLLGVAIAALPFLLMVAFHGPDTTDSRGRRTHPAWRAAPHKAQSKNLSA